MRKSRTAAAETKATIIRTAARLFRERGFDAVSINDVMTAAGLTVGGFYRHFESKEALAGGGAGAARGEGEPGQGGGARRGGAARGGRRGRGGAAPGGGGPPRPPPPPPPPTLPLPSPRSSRT